MLSHILKLSLAIAVSWLLLSSCSKEVQPSNVNLDGTEWRLLASINALNGEKEVTPNSEGIFLNFQKGYRYTLNAGEEALSARYHLDGQNKKAIFYRTSKAILNSKKIGKTYEATVTASSIELIGSTLKLINAKSNKFLVFERIK